MRVRQVICHTVAVVALGAMCMAQSTTGSATQSTDQQTTDQQRMEQQNNENSAPSNVNRNDSGMSRAGDDGASSNNGIDTGNNKADDRTREIENEKNITKSLQQGNN